VLRDCDVSWFNAQRIIPKLPAQLLQVFHVDQEGFVNHVYSLLCLEIPVFGLALTAGLSLPNRHCYVPALKLPMDYEDQLSCCLVGSAAA
jgi:hypothetical protein